MRTGGCLCGAVRYVARDIGNFGVCHCKMCQRWAGSALFGVNVPEAAMEVAGQTARFRSSDWASREFCPTCGSVLWYRFDHGRDGTGDYEVAVGSLDDANGLILDREINIDIKPDSWALAGEQEQLTEEQTLALFGAESEGA
jgi:hypothetical protein